MEYQHIMSIDLVGSLVSINRSDASSRTESEESTPPRPEQDDDVAQLPFVPQRARLMPGGPRFISASPSTLTCRNFWSARTVAPFRGYPHPATRGLTCLFAARAIAPNFLGAHGRSGSGLQPTRMQGAPPGSIPTSTLLKRLSCVSSTRASISAGFMSTLGCLQTTCGDGGLSIP